MTMIESVLPVQAAADRQVRQASPGRYRLFIMALSAVGQAVVTFRHVAIS